MPKSSRGGKSGGYTTVAKLSTSGTPKFKPLTAAQVDEIAEEQNEFLSEQDINVRYAIKQYIRADQQANGYSRAQNLNNKLETGGKLDQTEKKMVTYMDRAMHPIGQDTMLVRADHATTASGSGLLDKLGVKGYQHMTHSQLQQSLVGRTWHENKYLSTSYNVANNPFISGSQAGGRSVIMNIKAGASTRMVVGDTRQSEYILARGGNYKITGARFTGRTVYPRAGGSLPQIAIDVEII